ncbi:MAG: DUF3375 domain-containing protein [Bacteroidaceae bacterium]|nr:DUF3375 domain-containing protein [Bacteroidaceae bacterium]
MELKKTIKSHYLISKDCYLYKYKKENDVISSFVEMNTRSNLTEILNTSPSVTLLRARSCNTIIDFFTVVFDDITVISHENIHSQLTEYLNIHGVDEDEENDILYTDTYEEKAAKYIKKWTDSGFLTNYRNEDGEIYYELSSHSNKVIDWISGLKQEEYIGTESKFKSIINQLKELVEYTNEDREKRLHLLENKKLEIEHQIQQLQMGEDVKVFEEYEIVPRFQQINKLAKELLTDFKDVDDIFKTIIKEIYQKQIDPSLNKGGILQYTFDALDELESSSQGKSFYSFWEFLLAREMQSELDTLIADLFKTLKEKNINSGDTFLQNMVGYLYESGRKVYQTNDKMADKLSRIIRENEMSKADTSKRIVQEIKNTLIEISKKGRKPELSLEVDDGMEINIPFDRKITFEQSENTEYVIKPDSETFSLEEFGELGKVFGNVYIDRKILERNIRETMKGKSQVTLSDVVEQHPLQQGLPELFAYFGALGQFPHKSINEDKSQAIVFDYENYKRIRIPEIIISL